MQDMKHRLAMGAGALALGCMILSAGAVQAADLGGSCCADLEERIAELEATTARKGNRKVNVTIYGQASKSLLFLDGKERDDVVVSENSAAETYVGIGGVAVIQPNLRAGFVLELGLGGYEGGLTGPGANTNETYVRQANLFLERDWGGDVLSRVTIGHLRQATDGIAEISTVNTAVVARLASLRPLNGPQIGEALDLYDGSRIDGLRADFSVSKLSVSASWGNGEEDDVWDVALQYGDEFGGFAVRAGVGYREGISVPSLGAGLPDLKVWSGSVSIKHIETGLFVNAMYGTLDVSEFGISTDDVRTWHVQSGIERKLFTALGATTIFAEYGELEDGTLSVWGGGVVQAFDAAAFDVYLNVRRLELDDGLDKDEATVGTVGGRIRF